MDGRLMLVSMRVDRCVSLSGGGLDLMLVPSGGAKRGLRLCSLMSLAMGGLEPKVRSRRVLALAARRSEGGRGRGECILVPVACGHSKRSLRSCHRMFVAVRPIPREGAMSRVRPGRPERKLRTGHLMSRCTERVASHALCCREPVFLVVRTVSGGVERLWSDRPEGECWRMVMPGGSHGRALPTMAPGRRRQCQLFGGMSFRRPNRLVGRGAVGAERGAGRELLGRAAVRPSLTAGLALAGLTPIGPTSV